METLSVKEYTQLMEVNKDGPQLSPINGLSTHGTFFCPLHLPFETVTAVHMPTQSHGARTRTRDEGPVYLTEHDNSTTSSDKARQHNRTNNTQSANGDTGTITIINTTTSTHSSSHIPAISSHHGFIRIGSHSFYANAARGSILWGRLSLLQLF